MSILFFLLPGIASSLILSFFRKDTLFAGVVPLAWYTLAEHHWYTLAGDAWYIITRLLTPLARFLHNAGCEIVECSSTYINKRFHACELTALAGVKVVEQPNFDRQLVDMAITKPDLVVSALATTNPLIGQGVVAKWSTEFAFMPIHGWSGVATLAGMFTKSIKRHAQLDLLNDPIWSVGLMPGVIPLQLK